MIGLKKILAIPTFIAILLQGSCHSIDQAPQQGTNVQSQATSNEEIDLKLVSEAFGHFIGKNLNSSPGISFDLEAIIKGMRNGASGKPSPMSEKEYEAAMQKLQERAFERLSSDNLKAANEFMKKNSTAEGIVEVEPGKLQYLLLEKGTGPKVEAHSSPLIHYTGKFLDGKVFGSSQEVGGPITIPLDQTIPGFSKGLLGMQEGEKRRLFIHPDLGYGTLGNLPPNALLIFDIEIIKADSQEEKKLSTDASKEDDDNDDLEDDDDLDDDSEHIEDDDDDQDDDDDDDSSYDTNDFQGGSLKR